MSVMHLSDDFLRRALGGEKPCENATNMRKMRKTLNIKSESPVQCLQYAVKVYLHF